MASKKVEKEKLKGDSKESLSSCAPGKNLGGRPTSYTEEIASRILDEVATNECSLEEICEKNPDFPCSKTIYLWRWKIDGFLQRYMHAKAVQAVIFGEKTIEISKEIKNYIYIDPETGAEKIDGGIVAMNNLIIKTRQWHSARLSPIHFGDKQVSEEKKDSVIEQLLAKIPNKEK